MNSFRPSFKGVRSKYSIIAPQSSRTREAQPLVRTLKIKQAYSEGSHSKLVSGDSACPNPNRSIKSKSHHSELDNRRFCMSTHLTHSQGRLRAVMAVKNSSPHVNSRRRWANSTKRLLT